jgi:hypothetical protein
MRVLHYKTSLQSDQSRSNEVVELDNSAAFRQGGDGDLELLRAPVIGAKVETGIFARGQNWEEYQGENWVLLQEGRTVRNTRVSVQSL